MIVEDNCLIMDLNNFYEGITINDYPTNIGINIFDNQLQIYDSKHYITLKNEIINEEKQMFINDRHIKLKNNNHCLYQSVQMKKPSSIKFTINKDQIHFYEEEIRFQSNKDIKFNSIKIYDSLPITIKIDNNNQISFI